MNRCGPKTRSNFLAILLTIGVLSAPVAAQDETKDKPDEERKARLRRVHEHMQKFVMRRANSQKDDNALIDQPLLTYGDSARANENGTLWAWGKAGRPAAFLELYQGTGVNARWVHAVTLTASERVTMKTPLTTSWQPEKTQIEPTPFAGAAVPDEKETVRLRQIKDLSRRFTAHEFWDPDNSRFELRLLVQPVHRYRDAAAQIQDGAAFVLAHGTNPEVILLLEAIGKTPGESRWHYSLARLGSAELHVEIDGKEVWKRERAPGVVGRPTDPYWLFFSPVEASE